MVPTIVAARETAGAGRRGKPTPAGAAVIRG
jgi:hypothetical protein